MERKSYVHFEKEIDGFKISFDFSAMCPLQKAFDFAVETIEEIKKMSEEYKAQHEAKNKENTSAGEVKPE